MCKFNYKQVRILVLVVFILINYSLSGDAACLRYDKKIAGLISSVYIESYEISIDGSIYNVADGCIITLNDKEASIKGLEPPSPGFYKWAELYLDSRNTVIKISAYYEVVEGIIKKISNKDKCLLLLEFQQDFISEKKYKKYFFPESSEKIFLSLRKGEHIVLIVAKNKVLAVYEVNGQL